MKPSGILLIAVAILCAAQSAHARTWYIKADGTGDAPTIRAGIDSAAAGDTVLVSPGTYTWTSEGAPANPWGMIWMKTGVRLRSEIGPEVTVLDAERRGRILVCVSVGDGAVIEGFTITGGNSDGIAGVGGGGIHIDSSNMTIRNNVIADNFAWSDMGGSGGGGIHCHSSPNTVITDNVITGNYTDFVGGGILHGVNAPAITDNLITDNTAEDKGGGICCINMDAEIYNNVIVGNSAPIGGGIYCQETAGEIANNTLLDNSGTDGLAIYCITSSSPLISQNIIAGCLGGPALYCDGSSSPNITCNDLWNNAGGDGSCTLGADNFSSDPMFCDPGASDYHLHEDSPCAPANSPGGCGLIGALPIGCWNTPISSLGTVIAAMAMLAVGVWMIRRKVLGVRFQRKRGPQSGEES